LAARKRVGDVAEGVDVGPRFSGEFAAVDAAGAVIFEVRRGAVRRADHVVLEPLVKALDPELQRLAEALLDAQAGLDGVIRSQARVTELGDALPELRGLAVAPDAGLERGRVRDAVARGQARIDRPSLEIARVVRAHARHEQERRARPDG